MAEVFETADVLVSLGGDGGNTVPLHKVTAGQIAVLQTLHGSDAVNEIKPNGTVTFKSMRVEKARLAAIYGGARDSEGNSILEKIYPGAAARIFQKITELELDASQFARGHVPEGLVDNRADIEADIEAGIDAANGYEPEEVPIDETEAAMQELSDIGQEWGRDETGASAVIDDGEGSEVVEAADEAKLQTKLAQSRPRGRKAVVDLDALA